MDINKSHAYAADNFPFLDMAFLPTVLQEGGQAQKFDHRMNPKIGQL